MSWLHGGTSNVGACLISDIHLVIIDAAQINPDVSQIRVMIAQGFVL